MFTYKMQNNFMRDFGEFYNDMLDFGEGFSEVFNTSNVKENKDDYVLDFEIPGVKKEDIVLVVEDGLLKLEGKRSDGKVYNGKWKLPKNIDEKHIAAKLVDGILTLTIKKAKKAKNIKITVE